MANTNEVKTFFTIDLSAYMLGLKSMLTMTQQTGAQLKPLLNVSIDKANFAEIDKTFDEYLAKVKESVPATEEAGKAAIVLGDAHDEEEKKVRKSNVAHGEHEMTLRRGKREALESFGATMFLVQGLMQMASSADANNKQMEKLNRAMSEGVGQGFELAGLLGMLGIASGGTAVAIGAVATVAITLVRVFGDMGDATKRNDQIQNDFARTLNGMTIPQLEAYRKSISDAIKAGNEQIESEKNQSKQLETTGWWYADIGMKLAKLLGITWAVKESEESLARTKKEGATIDEQIASKRKTQAEIEQFVIQAKIDSLVRANDRQRAEAKRTYDDETVMINSSEAVGKAKDEALTASRVKYNSKIREITIQERQEALANAKIITDAYLQAAETRFESELNRLKTSGKEQMTAADTIDTQIIHMRLNRYRGQMTELAKVVGPLSPEQLQKQTALEGQITQLETQEAQKRISIKQKEKQDIDALAEADLQDVLARLKLRGTMHGQTEEQIAAQSRDRLTLAKSAELGILLKAEEDGKVLTQDEKLRKTQLETDLTNLTTEGVNARIQLRQMEVQAMTQGVMSIASNLSSAYGDMASLEQARTTKVLGEEKKRKQSALDTEKAKKLAAAQTSEERQAIEEEFAEKKQAIDEEMDGKAQAQNRAAFERYKTLQKITTYISAVVSAQEAFKALVGIPVVGPVLAAAAAAAALVAGIARVSLIDAQEVPGLATGAKITKPGIFQLAEGGETEYVLPQSFIKSDFMPQVKESILAALSVSGTGQGVILQIHINGDYIGDQEHFERLVKPAIEDAMRRAGTSDAGSVFKNSKS